MTSFIDSYTLGRTLGEGFSAKVKVGVAPDGTEYALKIFDLDNPKFNSKAFKLLQEEVNATTQLKHPNVVCYHDFRKDALMKKVDGTTANVAYIVQEMISGGELFDYVANSGAFSEDVCRYYFKQMLMAIHYIHRNGFSHRDLKPENILLDKNYNVKIVDFGFACPIEGRDGSGTNKSSVGTRGYMAPEILKKQRYQGPVVDLFALGVILFIMRTGHPPFGIASDDDNYYKMLAMNRPDLFWQAHIMSSNKPANYFSDDFKDLITSMLAPRAAQRLCIADIAGHPWMCGDYATAEQIRTEFANRHRINKHAAQEAARRSSQRRQSGRARRDLQLEGKVYLEQDEEILNVEEAAGMEIINLRTKEFNEDQSPAHAFFSTFKPSVLMKQLVEKVQEQGQNFEVSDKTWKINIDMINEQDEDRFTDEQPQIEGQCKAQVQMLKVKDQDKFCMKFVRKAGSAMVFYEQVDRYIEMLSECNNTNLSD